MYKQRYLKYKNKYLQLHQIAGATIKIINEITKPPINVEDRNISDEKLYDIIKLQPHNSLIVQIDDLDYKITKTNHYYYTITKPTIKDKKSPLYSFTISEGIYNYYLGADQNSD